MNPSAGLPRPLLRFKANGLLPVGDPHMSCVTPGRRLEEDFLPVVLDKITQARQIAEERDLLVVFLGDMMENATNKKNGTSKVVEDTNRILSGFARAMDFRECITVGGNHEKNEVRLTEGTTLATMRDLRMVHVMEESRPFAIVDIRGVKVGLGGTPHGQDIPKDVRGVFGEPVDRVVWITHSQFEFDIKNPFLDRTFEIQGCDLVINGHDHTTMTPRCEGQTWWFNPGNITRMSVDCANHVPSVWEWNPEMAPGELQQHALKYNPLVFDMRGLQVGADVAVVHAEETARAKSLFAELLIADRGAEMERTVGGDLLGADIERYIEDHPSMTEVAQLMLRNLHARGIDRPNI